MAEPTKRRGRPTKKKEVAQEEVIVEQEQNIHQEDETITISLEEAMERGLLDGIIPQQPIIRHTQIFCDEISQESVQQLINELNNYNHVDLFFATNGGEIYSMEALVHYLNTRKDEIKVILTSYIASAGTFLLTRFKGVVEISDNLDFILFHQGDRMTFNIRKSGELSRKQLLKQMKVINDKLYQEFEALGLNERELRKFKKGYDVTLYRKDFHRLKIDRNEN